MKIIALIYYWFEYKIFLFFSNYYFHQSLYFSIFISLIPLLPVLAINSLNMCFFLSLSLYVCFSHSFSLFLFSPLSLSPSLSFSVSTSLAVTLSNFQFFSLYIFPFDYPRQPMSYATNGGTDNTFEDVDGEYEDSSVRSFSLLVFHLLLMFIPLSYSQLFTSFFLILPNSSDEESKNSRS